MVCNRCIMVVKHEFEALGYPPLQVQLGEVEINSELTSETITDIDKHLQTFGFEIIDNTKSRIIEKIKNTIVQLIHHSNDDLKVNYSTYIEAVLKKDYNYLSNLFSEIEGTTIEKYIIRQKIDRVKELLVYGDLSLDEIAQKLHYSHTVQLSSQFKRMTGLTPSHFRQLRQTRRTYPESN